MPKATHSSWANSTLEIIRKEKDKLVERLEVLCQTEKYLTEDSESEADDLEIIPFKYGTEH